MNLEVISSSQWIFTYEKIHCDTETMEKYFEEVYNSLLSKEHENEGIELETFFNYVKYPIFITEKLFYYVSDNFGETNLMTKSQFVQLMMTLYLSPEKNFLNFLKNFLDFNKDGIIKLKDLELLLFHFHYLNNSDFVYDSTFDITIDIIRQILTRIFYNNKSISINDFIQKIEFVNSDIIYLFKIFFEENKPFSHEQISFFKEKSNIIPHNKNRNEHDSNQEVKLIQPSNTLLQYLKKFDKMKYFKDSKSNDENNDCVENDNNNDLEVLSEFESDIINAKLFDNYPQFLTFGGQKTYPFSKTQTFPSFKALSLPTHSPTEKINLNSPIQFKGKCIISRVEFLEGDPQELDVNKVYLIHNNLFISSKKKKQLEIIFLSNILKITITSNKKENEKYGHYITVLFRIKEKETKLILGFIHYKECLQLKELLEKFDTSIPYNSFIKEKIIAKGGFGLIYSSKNKATNKEFIIKQINKKDIKYLFELAICHLLKNISHPNIIHIFGIYETVAHINVIMEKCDVNLYSFMLNNEPNYSEIYEIVSNIIQGISCLHTLGIVHRDIKLENILLCATNESNPQVRVIDFGLSTILGHYEFSNESMGTEKYMSPEMIGGSIYNHKQDIWSLGVVIYVLLKRRFPSFLVNGYYPNCLYNNKGINIDLKSISDKTERALANIVNKCLNKDILCRVDISTLKKIISTNE